MGYRSTIGIAIQKDALLKHTLLSKKPVPELLITADQSNYPECMQDDAETVAYFYIDYVKWYGTYEDVMAVESLLERIEEDPDHELDSDSSYGFLRIGEHDDDIETRGDPYQYDMYVERNISFPMEFV